MKRRTRSLSIWICVLVIGLWLTCLGLLTWAVAVDFQRQIYDAAQLMVSDQGSAYHGVDISQDTPGYGSLQQIMHLGDPYTELRTQKLLPIVQGQVPQQMSSKDWFFNDWELLYGFQAVTVFYDEAGEPLVKSGDLATLCYITDESWIAGDTQIQGVAYIDRDRVNQDLGLLSTWHWPMVDPPSPDYGILRATGYFDGDEFIPISLDQAADHTLDRQDYDQYVEAFCRLDAQGRIQWENELDLAVPPDAELVTIYIRETGGATFIPKPLYFEGKQYASLVDLALERGPEWQYSGDLIDTVFTLSGAADESTGAATYRLTVHTKPLRYAVVRMKPVYIWGSLVLGLCLWLLLRHIHKNISRPLKDLAISMTEGNPITPSSGFLEVNQSEEYLKQSQAKIHDLQNDIQRLEAALDHARDAEEARRRLVSNITHELKTPLAVIHSYAEGLQTGIAEDKTAYYLSTILEETEKMDAMVLEMLDLSRLEAGKVRLSTDQFSLLSLTQEIMAKLAPEESRHHAISFGHCNDCMVVADEGRIAQVVTNLISNALKYTPKDGRIMVQVFSHEGSAHFKITNTAEHLAEDVLEKLFEPFYRVDAARSDKGTGLGLSIAKNIIHLHRGTITARNTLDDGDSCLEFAFQLPLS